MSHIEVAMAALPVVSTASARRLIPSLFMGMVFKPRSTLGYLRDQGGHNR